MAFIPFFLGYGFGQCLTDSYQKDTDSISAPYRPLVKGEITERDLRIVAFTGFALSAIFVLWLNAWNALWAGLSVLGLATYTFFKKHYWFAGPFYNAWIVVLLPVMGIISVTRQGLFGLLQEEFLYLALLSFFSYSNFVIIGYLKDITADRRTGYKTFPVIFGWNPTVWVGDLFLVLSALFGYLLLRDSGTIPAMVFWAATLLAVTGQLYAHLVKPKSEIRSSYSIETTVRSFILWHLAVVLQYRPEWLIFSVLFYLLFEWVLYGRPSQSQI
jgi:4-hydroxybenzoate polyprenyltransferase